MFGITAGCSNRATVANDTTNAELPRDMVWNAPVVVLADSEKKRLRFFTRAGHLEFCGHGLLAGAFALTSKLGQNRLSIVAETLATDVWCHDGEAFFASLGSGSPQPIPREKSCIIHSIFDRSHLCDSPKGDFVRR